MTRPSWANREIPGFATEPEAWIWIANRQKTFKPWRRTPLLFDASSGNVIMQKTMAQLQADWVSHGNIGRLQAKLASEPNEAVRKSMEELLAREREAIAQNNVEPVWTAQPQAEGVTDALSRLPPWTEADDGGMADLDYERWCVRSA
jgi:hypothetical protein